MTTVSVAEFISTLSFEDLPEAVVHATVRSFYNALGCVIGGANHGATQRALKALQPLFANRSCSLIGNETLCDVSNAALINGIASHVHDYDDTHLHTVIHPAGAVVTGLTAFVEHLEQTSGTKVSGRRFLTALAAGIEVGLRLGNAVSPNHYSEGWHITGTVSPIAVAAAISNLALKGYTQKINNALGIATSQPVGIRVHFGTDTKAFHVGRAAQNGVLSCLLAMQGFTAAPDSIEGHRGWIEVLGNGKNEFESQVAQLLASKIIKPPGTTSHVWAIEKNTFKPFPCGIVIHPTIDACLQLHKDLGLHNTDALAAIESVQLTVNPLVLDLTGKKFPKNELEAKFSVYHGAAIALVLGLATPDEYADEVVNDTRIVNMRDKVVAESSEDVASDEVLVKVVTSSAEVERHVQHAIGSLHRPLTDEDLHRKFLKSAAKVFGRERAEKTSDLAWGVQPLEDVMELMLAMR